MHRDTRVDERPRIRAAASTVACASARKRRWSVRSGAANDARS